MSRNRRIDVLGKFFYFLQELNPLWVDTSNRNENVDIRPIVFLKIQKKKKKNNNNNKTRNKIS